jgi:hypothetical protein
MKNDDSYYLAQIKEIEEKVQKLNYSQDNFLDLINYMKEAIRIAKKVNTDKTKNYCLINLIRTKNNQLRAMQSKNIKDEQSRERYFLDAKTNFITDLTMY